MMTRVRVATALLGLGLIVAGILVAMPPDGLEAIHSRSSGSLRFEDRHGVELRDVPIDGSRARWIGLDELPPWVEPAFTMAEDQNFRWHVGVDPVAVVRALRDNRKAGRVISGASTISMQVVRLAAGRSPGGGLVAKLGEALDAIRLERRFGKDEILEQYLNRASFGRGALGLESATVAWFGHSARTLTPGEAAWLAILPRAPERLSRPDALAGVESRRGQLLVRLRGGRSTTDHFQDAMAAPTIVPRKAAPFEAPHLTTWLLASLPSSIRSRAGVIRTTLDHRLQTGIAERVKPRLARLAEKGAREAAVVVVDNRTRELVVLLGSVDFFDPEAGQVNGALALRQPGSTLKPFTYALAFDSGFTPASLVHDDPRSFPAAGGPFVPRNYGGQSFGSVRIREALASSLNIAAVDALSRIGADRLLSQLVALDLMSRSQATGEAGLGLTLGVAEVRLFDLANAYVTLARGGLHGPTSVLLGAADPLGRPLRLPPLPAERRLISPVSAWWISDILADGDARLRAFGRDGVLEMPWPVAIKTGTSSDWRDNWAVGYTREWTVAVWVGDFTGAPMHQVSGVFGAAPIVREIFGQLASVGELTRPVRPPGLNPHSYCIDTGEEALSDCPGTIVEWLPDTSRPGLCQRHAVRNKPERVTARAEPIQVSSDGDVAASRQAPPTSRRAGIRKPATGDIYFLDPALPRGSQVLEFQADSEGGEALTWWVDGRKAGRTRPPHRLSWPLEPGSHRVTIGAVEPGEAIRFSVQTGPSRPRETR